MKFPKTDAEILAAMQTMTAWIWIAFVGGFLAGTAATLVAVCLW